ncbi:MAG: zinc-binding dehydrogenase [Proteobacteria bacterium]|nr:zinc-binding dehydrogenase [Pseudomonadota bacterium]
MRAIGIRRFGGLDALETLSIDPPAPGAGEVRVKIAFAGINPVDVHVRRGAFLRNGENTPSWPLVLGYEGAGTVEALGPDVTGLKPGDRVAWSGRAGSHAEFAVLPAWRLVPVPDNVPLDIACALQLDGLLAHALAVSVFPIKERDVVLIQSGGEPASLFLTQIAKAQGASVVATVRRDADAAEFRAAGADRIVLRGAPGDAAADLAAALPTDGAHVVFDGVGREAAASSIRACRRRGVVVLFGAVDEPAEPIRPDDLAAAGSIYLTRPHLADFLQDATETRWRMDGLFDAWTGGRLKVGIGRVIPLEAAREGHAALEAGAFPGKILIKI